LHPLALSKRRAPWRFAIGGKVVEIEVEGSLIANEAGLLVQAALGGAGVLYVLEEFAAPMIATGQLVPLLGAWIPPPSEGFFLYYPSRRQGWQAAISLHKVPFADTNHASPIVRCVLVYLEPQQRLAAP
jgi:DNA-binding transcriptional LysR family regulator